MSANLESSRGDGALTLQEECSTSTSLAIDGPTRADETDATADHREAMHKMQSALRNKIQELEVAEAEEKEITKTAKRAVREVQKFLSSKEHDTADKVQYFQQKFIERVNEHVKSEKTALQLQKKLNAVTAERAAMSDEVRRLTSMNEKLQDLCRTLQTQNKSVLQEAQEKAADEAQQREELSQRMETAMKDISSRLEEHSLESERCMKENTELRAKLEHVGRFCEELDRNHKEQLARKDTQISFLRERIAEQTELIDQYSRTERLMQEKCTAAEEARDTYASQLEDAKEKINGFCESFERSNAAFRQLQDQVDMSQKIQKKMQQESDLLKKHSDLVQQKSDRMVGDNEKLQEQVDGMRGKLEHSVSEADHNKLRSQKAALEKLCRVQQAEIKELRKYAPKPPLPSKPATPPDQESSEKPSTSPDE